MAYKDVDTFFEIGFVVAIKSGGPHMTVTQADETTCTCGWFDDQCMLRMAKIPKPCLIRCECDCDEDDCDGD